MNIVTVPYHDWRKILKEGFRTRDAHFIESLEGNEEISKVLVINRPTTPLEYLIKRKNVQLNYKVLKKNRKFTLYEVSEKLYLIDFVSNDMLGQVLNPYLWISKKYSDAHFITFINESLALLQMENAFLYSQNVWASSLLEKLPLNLKIFDAWDNFLKFPHLQKHLSLLKKNYETYADVSMFWTTNTEENQQNFQKQFQPKAIYVISNGVDVERFSTQNTYRIPEDIKTIDRPIVGFGGKVTHLLDVELLNHLIQNSTHQFVIVGQILDKQIYKKIEKRENFHYLGDKHYDDYPNYVNAFDICILPYKSINNHSGDSMKLYEYLALHKKVVSTKGNGADQLEKYIYLCENNSQFLENIQNTDNDKPYINENLYSWNYRVMQLLENIKANHYQD